MAIVDKTGQKFGRLTVLRLSEKRHPKNNKILWECQCDCGNPEIIYATTGNLTQGYKTSCGCAAKQQRKNLAKQRIKDLSNQKFGKLTAKYLIENTSPPLWHCTCDCGNEIDVTSTALTKKERTSCGCKRKELRKDLIGQTFGKLTVLSRVENYISPSGIAQVRYLCKCQCGNETIVSASSLKQGLTSSCGCIRSMGELAVEKFLIENNIDFIREYKFQDCCDKRPLPFDFCILNRNKDIAFLIEINGKQHYEPKFISDEEEAKELLEYIQYHDKIKQEYCIDNNLDLLVIPYYQLNKFQDMIIERIEKHGL